MTTYPQALAALLNRLWPTSLHPVYTAILALGVRDGALSVDEAAGLARVIEGWPS